MANKDKIIAVIEAEKALIDGQLANTTIKRCGHAGHCAIGALLYAEGVTNRELTKISALFGGEAVDDFWYEREPEDWDYETNEEYQKARKEYEAKKQDGETIPLTKYARILRDVYGLSRDEAEEIMSFNDSFHLPPAERGMPDWKQDRMRTQRVIEKIRSEL